MSPFSKTTITAAAFGLMASWTMGAHFTRVPKPRCAMIHAVASSDFLVAGEVRARTETNFTLLVRDSEIHAVQVTQDTAIVKGGAIIKLSDLMVGDKVNATLMRDGEGKLRAVNVTVRVGNDSL